MYGIELPNTRQMFREINQLDIWSKILFHSVSVGQRFTSPLRPDTNGNCYLQEYRGNIFLSDHAQPQYNRYTCVHALADIQGTSYYDALVRIYYHQKFGEPLGEIVKSYNVIPGEKRHYHEGHVEIDFEPFMIGDQPAYTSSDRDYWQPRQISTADLLHPLQPAYSIKWYFINGRKFYPRRYPCYALTFAETGHVKLYCPNDRDNKFIASNISKEDDVWRWTKPGRKRAVIQKAWKDGMETATMTDLHADVFAFQGEGVFPERFINGIRQSYDEVLTVYDNDEAGRRNAEILQTMIPQAKNFFFPNRVGPYTIKDTDDMVYHGMRSTAQKMLIDAFAA